MPTDPVFPADATPRLSLPLLAPGQAHKELFHNEALVRLDALVQPAVLGREADPARLDPALGDAWIVAGGAVGDWAGRDGALAFWTAGGWRFAAPAPGQSVYRADTGARAVYRDGAWEDADSLSPPDGGATVDTEARAAIAELQAAARRYGFAR